MDVRYRVDHEHSLIVIRLPEMVTAPVIGYAMRAIITEPEMKSGYSRLWDLRTTRHLNVLPGDVQEHAEIIREGQHKLGKGKTALLVRREIDEITGELYIAKARQVAGIEGGVFYSLHTAAEFLNVPVEACHV